jgi:CheY-like chemotaxis protein
LRLLLSSIGFPAEIVRGGEAAVCRALEAWPRVVLLDINLPGADGWEVARRLRAALGGAARLIGLAPYSWDGDPGAWAAAGFDGWLRKPVDVGELLQLLEGA